MIICGHEDNSRQFTVTFEDNDIRLWQAFVGRYGENQLTREHGLYETIGNGLYNPRFKACLRLLIETLQEFMETLDVTPQRAQVVISHVCRILEVEEENLLNLLQGD